MRCIDVHCYYGKWGFPIWDMSVEDILAAMQSLLMDKCIMMSSQSIQYDFVEGNAELAEVVSEHQSLYGYVYINMHYPELSLAEIEKYLGSDKFVGVKYNGEISRAAACAEENDPIFDLVEGKYGKPLLLHTWGLPEHGNVMAYSLPAQALELALKHPRLKIIMGHMGGPEWMSAIHAAQKADNLFLDTCASYADYDKVGTAVEMLGADRVMFGSGMTECNPFLQKGAVLDAEITNREKEMVLYENAQRLFRI
jgi:predicted TIM-barrel fold metal-dependent hydrolase